MFVSVAICGGNSFRRMYRHYPDLVPLRRHITLDDVGNTAVWLSSEMAAGVTGEVIYVDSGYNILGVPVAADQENV